MDRRNLDRDLEDLEADDPEVAEAGRRLDAVRASILSDIGRTRSPSGIFGVLGADAAPATPVTRESLMKVMEKIRRDCPPKPPEPIRIGNADVFRIWAERYIGVARYGAPMSVDRLMGIDIRVVDWLPDDVMVVNRKIYRIAP